MSRSNDHKSTSRGSSVPVEPDVQPESGTNTTPQRSFSFAIPSTRKRKRDTEIPVTIHEDVPTKETLTNSRSTPGEPHLEKENAPPLEMVKVTDAMAEPSEEAGQKPTIKRKKRKSIGQQRRKTRTSTSSVEEPSILVETSNGESLVESIEAKEPTTGTVRARASATPTYIRRSEDLEEAAPDANFIDSTLPIDNKETRDSIEAGNEALASEETTEESLNTKTKPAKRRRKRKSVVLRKKKRTSTESMISRRQTLDFGETPYRNVPEDEGSDFEPEEFEDSPVVETRKKPAPPQSKRKRRAETLERVMPSIEDQDSEVSVQPHTRRSASVPASSSSNRPSNSSYPIQVHRLTNIGALPTIQEEEPGEVDASPGPDEDDAQASRPTKRFKRSHADIPNAIDVLSQLCRETLSTSFQRLTSQGQSGAISRSSLNLRQKAITSFQEALESRLFEISQALESKFSLEARLRQTKRQKSSMQNEWLEIRKEREQVALRIDDVRRRNAEAELREREARSLHEAASKLEMVVENISNHRESEEEQQAGLEFMLRSVAAAGICGKVNYDDGSPFGTGLLGQVKDFNGQLERMVAVLEGR